MLRAVALHLNAERLRVFLAKHTLQNALGDFGHQFAAAQNVENLRACAAEVDLLWLHEIAVLHRRGDVVDERAVEVHKHQFTLVVATQEGVVTVEVAVHWRQTTQLLHILDREQKGVDVLAALASHDGVHDAVEVGDIGVVLHQFAEIFGVVLEQGIVVGIVWAESVAEDGVAGESERRDSHRHRLLLVGAGLVNHRVAGAATDVNRHITAASHICALVVERWGDGFGVNMQIAVDVAADVGVEQFFPRCFEA